MAMAIRSNHYDAAFEEFLRERRVPYVAVDEKRRALVGDDSLKSLDFIVESPGRERGNLLVDVKGRRFGGSSGRWENWATDDDLNSMRHWQTVFGPHFTAALAFVYWLDDAVDEDRNASPKRTPRPVGADRFDWGGRRYAVVAVGIDEYADACRTRSQSWGTVSVPRATFRKLARPLTAWLDGEPEPAPLLRTA